MEQPAPLYAVTEAILRGVLKQCEARKAELSGLLDNVQTNLRTLELRLEDSDRIIHDLSRLLGQHPEVH